MNSMDRPARATRPAWLKRLVEAHKREIATALALGFAAASCAALLMFTSGYLISATAIAGTTLFSIMVPVACVQLFGLGRPAARYLERLASHSWVLHITSDLRVALFRSVAARLNDPARGRATGEYLALLSDDVAHLQNLYLRVVFPSAVAYLLALGAALLFGFFSPPFALIILLAFAGVIVPLPLACLLATRATSEQAKTLKAEAYAQLADDASGALDWVLANRAAEARARNAELDRRIRTLEEKSRLRQRAFSLASTLLLGALLCGVLAWAGVTFGPNPTSADATENINWIAAFALGFFPLIEAFAALPAAFSESTARRDSITRLDSLLSDAGADQVHIIAGQSNETANDSPTRAGTSAASIAFDNVTYTHPGAPKPALENVSLSIERGSSVAILGRSGAGKSTLAKLACGTLAPDTGSIAILGRALEPGSDLSRTVGFLGQAPYLFNRSLRDNLTLGVLDASDEQLISALERMGLAQKLAALPHGLDTIIGETGVGFSGGEAHRVALTRILVANPPVIVLDEPFSAIDPETERDLLELLFTAFAGKTLVIITHHLAEIERFDRVIFIEGARIDLDGSPAELMQSSTRFRTLVNLDR